MRGIKPFPSLVLFNVTYSGWLFLRMQLLSNRKAMISGGVSDTLLAGCDALPHADSHISRHSVPAAPTCRQSLYFRGKVECGQFSAQQHWICHAVVRPGLWNDLEIVDDDYVNLKTVTTLKVYTLIKSPSLLYQLQLVRFPQDGKFVYSH
ncbi:hypothetical protein [Winslowiella iniecta]|uniref:hypothetical protein n=1 Tax=Winslowiella iniecta TaxID=1560201 RepID=UPI000AFA38BE|nr:hypothetical protein [Winslowiella iniecta]